MFLLKKILSPLLFPVTICLGSLLLGLFLFFLARRKKAGTFLLLFSVLVLGLLSFDPVSDSLLRPLEYRYPPLVNTQIIRNVKWVVVLGGGHTSDPALPEISQLSHASLARLMEGIRLYRELPGSKLILSGGKPFERVADAEIMARVAVDMGAKREDLVLEEVSKDTEEEAHLIGQIVARERFALVTSASHMPRAMALFKNLGMDPVPAPTDYLVKESERTNPGRFYPRAENLHKAERAFYEYLGLGWSKLRGRI